MSIAYRKRLKAIKVAKSALRVSVIPTQSFQRMQTDWIMRIQGPCLGSLQDFIDAGKLRFPNRPIKIKEDISFGPCNE